VVSKDGVSFDLAIQLVCPHVALLLLAKSAHTKSKHEQVPMVPWQARLPADWN